MNLPAWLNLFAPLFSGSVWKSAIALLMGAILTLGKRTVSAILRVLGLAGQSNYQRYHAELFLPPPPLQPRRAVRARLEHACLL
jgi:hypothetical protein